MNIGMNEEGQDAGGTGSGDLRARCSRSRQVDRELRKSLADSYSSLSDLQYHAGQTKASLDNYSRVIELQERCGAEDPSDVELGRALAEATPGER